MDDAEWTFVFGSDGRRYEVGISDALGSAFLSRVKRTTSDWGPGKECPEASAGSW